MTSNFWYIAEMSIAERPDGHKNQDGDQEYRTHEQIFGESNKAKIIASTEYYIDPRGGFHHNWRGLSGKYQPIFGKLGRIKEPHELYKESPDTLGWFGGETYFEDDYSEGEFARPGDSGEMIWLREREAEKMADILFSPSTDPTQIEARQRTLRELSQSADLDDLLEAKDKSYVMLIGMSVLTRERSYETEWGVNRRDAIDLFHRGITTITIRENEGDEGWAQGDVIERRNLREEIDRGAALILEGTLGTDTLLANPGLEGTLFRDTLSDLPGFARSIRKKLGDVVPFKKSDKPKGIYCSFPSPSDRVSEIYREISNKLLKAGAVLELARKIRDEGWGEVTFEQDQPYGYTGGWSLDLKKKDQVPNDGPADTPITILSGANTSGKSFFMNSDFLIRIAAQSLGYAPVESANLPIARNFINLGRASTDSFNDLSAFMNEVKRWKEILGEVGPGTRLYSDEGYSTTSPEDQASLMLATARYIKGLGGSVMLATHNDVVLSRGEQDPDTSIYHLDTIVGKKGNLIRRFKLLPGVNESLALAVAKGSEFPDDITEGAEGYLKGEFSVLPDKIEHSFPEVVYFSENEREEMKLEVAALDHLFPKDSKTAIFALLSKDDEFSVDAFLRHLMPDKRRLTTVFDRRQTSSEMMARLILRVGALSPAEILERQRMFSELVRGRQKDLETATQNAGYIGEVYATIVAYMNEGIGLNSFKREKVENELRNAQLKPEYQKPLKITFYEPDLKVAIAFLRIQQKVTEDKFEQSGLLNAFIAFGQEVGDNHNLTNDQKAKYEELFLKLAEVDDQFLKAPLGTVGIDDVREELEIIQKRFRRTKREGDIDDIERDPTGENSLAFALLAADKEFSAARLLIATLRTTDSVYLHQAANYLGEILKGYVEVLQGKRTDHSIPNPRHLYEVFWEKSKLPISQTIAQTEALCDFVGVINEKGLSPVGFNSTGEIKFENGFNIFKEKGEQVRNSVDINLDQRVEVLTGPNGSGKTFYEKDAVAAVLIALATGFAPADRATMPVFDSVAYLDRVTQRDDYSLSSFAQDLEYWKKILSLMGQKNAIFAAVDEAFSSTSPSYQEALTYAVISKFLQSRNHFLVLSTHNHRLVEQIEPAHQESIVVNHFGYRVEDGNVVFEYQKQPGHELSHAVEVARKLGLPEKITSLATN